MDFQAEFLSLAEERDLRYLAQPEENPERAISALEALLAQKLAAEQQGSATLSASLESKIASALSDDDFCGLAANVLRMELAARLAPNPLRLMLFEDAFRERAQRSPTPLLHLLTLRVADCFVPLPPHAGNRPEIDEERAQEALDAFETALVVLPEDCVDWQDEAGNTALHCAVCYLSVESAHALLDAGANPDIRNHLGCAAFDTDFFDDFLKNAPEPPEPARVHEMRALMESHALRIVVDDADAEWGDEAGGDSGDSGDTEQGAGSGRMVSGGSARRL